MAESRNRLDVLLAAQDRELVKAVNRAVKKIENYEKRTRGNLDKSNRHWKKHSTQVKASSGRIEKAVAGIGAAIGALSGLRKLTALREVFDEIGKTSIAVGATTDELQKLQYALEITGVSGARAEKIYAKIAQNAVYASQGLATYTRIFDYFGVQVRDHEGKLKSNHDLLLELADAYAGAKDQGEAFGYLTQLLGARMARVAVLLKEGSSGIKALEKQAEESGAVVNEKFIAEMQVLNDELTLTKKRIMTDLAEPALAAAKAINKLYMGFKNLSETMERTFRGVKAIPYAFKDMAGFLGHTFGGMDSFGGDGSGPRYGTYKWGQTGPESTASKTSVTLPEIGVTASVPPNLKAAEDFFMSDKQARSGMHARDIEPRIRAIKKINEVIEAGKTPAQRRNELEQQAQELLKSGSISALQYAEAMKALAAAKEQDNEQTDMYSEAIEQMTNRIENGFENAIQSIITGSGNVKDAVRGMASSVISELTRIMISKPLAGGIANAIAAAFGASSGGGGGLLGSFLGGVSSLFGGGSIWSGGGAAATNAGPVMLRAGGGPVTRNQPYVVGEKGPELFYPGQSGMIYPNSMTHGQQGGFTLVQNINIDSTDGSGVSRALEDAFPEWVEAAKSEVMGSMTRPHQFRHIMRGYG